MPCTEVVEFMWVFAIGYTIAAILVLVMVELSDRCMPDIIEWMRRRFNR